MERPFKCYPNIKNSKLLVLININQSACRWKITHKYLKHKAFHSQNHSRLQLFWPLRFSRKSEETEHEPKRGRQRWGTEKKQAISHHWEYSCSNYTSTISQNNISLIWTHQNTINRSESHLLQDLWHTHNTLYVLPCWMIIKRMCHYMVL